MTVEKFAKRLKVKVPTQRRDSKKVKFGHR